MTTPLPLHELFTIISPQLPALGLAAKKTGSDFEITRIRPAQPYFLNQEESKRQDAFFAAGMIPDVLAQSIEQYITKKVGKEWNDPVIIERLRRAIVAQKDDYWKPAHKRSLQYTKGLQRTRVSRIPLPGLFYADRIPAHDACTRRAAEKKYDYS